MNSVALQQSDESLRSIRAEACQYEASLPPDQRKRLGQFFTGLPLGRLLASLSLRENTNTVVDPMAGTGDLLDATMDFRNERVVVLDGIEVDGPTADLCRTRLSSWSHGRTDLAIRIQTGSAFHPDSLVALETGGYDLVITNPPYVRYQTVATSAGPSSLQSIRDSLQHAVRRFCPADEQAIWSTLVNGFSGLSDLSVPAWLLSGLLTKPGTGVLAIVAPATWRSRNYADVLQYMLSRFFTLEVVVADRQPGWFSQALVRTHLVVAKRLSTANATLPLNQRKGETGQFPWVEIDSSAKRAESLVGSLYDGADSELQFARDLFANPQQFHGTEGVDVSMHSHADEQTNAMAAGRSAKWYTTLEGRSVSDLPLFSATSVSTHTVVPRAVAEVLPHRSARLTTLNDSGIKTGQGLRTGCNDFFYVDLIEQASNSAEVELSALFDNERLEVPLDCLVPVLRRQNELADFVSGRPLLGRALVLESYVLADSPDNDRTIMPPQLSLHVVRSQDTYRGSGRHRKLIPDLTAVRTNERPERPGSPARRWYMLPPFARRHLPDAFVPRINQNTPVAYLNRKAPVLIDANFSTLWDESARWSGSAIVAFLNSAWARACMEAIGTPMGGGALKLEATHLARLPIPEFTDPAIARLAEIGLPDSDAARTALDGLVTAAVLGPRASDSALTRTTDNLRNLADALSDSRRRER